MPISKQQMLPVYLLLLSFLLFESRDFAQAQSSPVSLNNLNRLIGISGAFFLAAYTLLKNGIPVRLPIELKLYSIYLFIALLSSFFYSDWLFYSIWKVFEVFTTFIVSVYIVRLNIVNSNTIQNLYETCILFFKFLIIMTILGVFIHPDAAIRPPTGEATVAVFGKAIVPYQLFGTIFRLNANTLGGMSAIILLVSSFRLIYLPRKCLNVIWVLISFGILVLAQSRTAWIGLLASILLLLLIHKALSKKIKVVAFITIILAILAFSNSIILYLTRGTSIDNLQNMTGRSIWWEIAINEYLNSSFFEQVIGLGFMTSSRTILSTALDKTVATLHSDYMDALISTGILGLATISLIVIIAFIKVIKLSRIKNIIVLELCGIIIILLIRTITGTTITSQNPFLLLFFSVVMYLSVVTQREIK